MGLAADSVHDGAARPVAERIAVLLCIGCGAVNLLRDCPGTCLDRPLELVPATELDEAETALAAARRAVTTLEELTARLGSAPPEGDAWRTSASADGRAPCACSCSTSARSTCPRSTSTEFFGPPHDLYA